jgi:hypothetical protein
MFLDTPAGKAGKGDVRTVAAPPGRSIPVTTTTIDSCDLAAYRAWTSRTRSAAFDIVAEGARRHPVVLESRDESHRRRTPDLVGSQRRLPILGLGPHLVGFEAHDDPFRLEGEHGRGRANRALTRR